LTAGPHAVLGRRGYGTLRRMDFLDFAKRHPRAARAVVGTVVKFREALPEAISDPHGWARMASCADVTGDSKKVRAVARRCTATLWAWKNQIAASKATVGSPP
jgi:hypothetical protein